MNKLLLLTIVILSTGCATAPQTTQVTDECAGNGGVHSIDTDSRPHVKVYCNDGTYRASW